MSVLTAAYDEIREAVEKEAERLDAEQGSWMTIDLGRGDVVTLVWLGSARKLRSHPRKVKQLLPVNLLFFTQHSKQSKVVAAVRKGLGHSPNSRKSRKVSR